MHVIKKLTFVSDWHLCFCLGAAALVCGHRGELRIAMRQCHRRDGSATFGAYVDSGMQQNFKC